MKVKIIKSENYKALANIDFGECFIPEGCEEDVYIKTRFLSCNSNCYKCVDLDTGLVVEFNELKMVRSVVSEVVVNENV